MFSCHSLRSARCTSCGARRTTTLRTTLIASWPRRETSSSRGCNSSASLVSSSLLKWRWASCPRCHSSIYKPPPHLVIPSRVALNGLSPCCGVFQEIYPPKVHQFAYVTDEACTLEEILSMEIIIMEVKTNKRSRLLDGFISPGVHRQYWPFALMVLPTEAGLVSDSADAHLLAQCLHAGGLPERDWPAAHPQVPPGHLHSDCWGTVCVLFDVLLLYVKWCDNSSCTNLSFYLNSSLQLLDLSMLDVRCLEFSNGVLAASALFHFSSLELVENVSGKLGVAHTFLVQFNVPAFTLAFLRVCPSVRPSAQLWRGWRWSGAWGGWCPSPWRCEKLAARPWSRSQRSRRRTCTTSRLTPPIWLGW